MRTKAAVSLANEMRAEVWVTLGSPRILLPLVAEVLVCLVHSLPFVDFTVSLPQGGNEVRYEYLSKDGSREW